MKVAVLGSGVIGTTTAYYLAKAGHDVTVIDRQPGPGLETSFANAGEVSAGYASPWAAPGIPFKAIKWMVARHAPMILRPSFDPKMYGWLAAMTANCTTARYAINKERLVRLAEYSRLKLIALRGETGIQYDERMQGTLQLFREQKQMDAIGKDVDVMRANGVRFEVLDRAGCIAVEPGLAYASEGFVGGLRMPEDETGDCFKFTNALAKLAEGMGVKFKFGVNILSLERGGAGIDSVRTSSGIVRADRYVMAMGSYSPLMLRPHGLKLPVYPVKGYSITGRITDEKLAPVSTLLDPAYKVAITRLGDAIRVGGIAEIVGYNHSIPIRRRETLLRSVESLFPQAGEMTEARLWAGLRPMTPDSTPIIGPTPLRNLYLNTGHGSLGWTMACGSARVVSDLVSGQAPEIATVDLSMARYDRRSWR